ncbi:MAG: glycosyltransferase family 39 protein [Cyanobacteria bacterium]|nr:glycosyltransferase family 39 protein [Cyanobacteriota bacterium]MDW8202703.1 glycosyltransferase family 39 protein [Cyanobacteriota bacterium SKYGB_h_bin112]
MQKFNGILQPSVPHAWHHCRPYLTLMGWTGLLLVASNGQQSLMAHDEGWYATQARWIVETGDWITPQWWGQPVYDRTIGLQWLIALCYQLAGISDGVARLPSLAACLGAVALTYAIGKRLLTPHLAWTGAAILPLCSLWLQYGRMAVQDIVLTCLELLGIWALLQAEADDRQRSWWGLLAGMTVGLGFLIKSIMILLPIVALVPYLLTHRRHFTNLGLHLGLVIGAIPVCLWFWFSYQQYGLLPFQQLFGHLFHLGSQQFHADAGFLYYGWNIPINAFPWALLAVVGLLIGHGSQVIGHPSPKNNGQLLVTGAIKDDDTSTGAITPLAPFPISSASSLLYLYPLLLLAALTVFSTRTPYYALQLYPFIGLWAAVALSWLTHRASPSITAGVSYGVAGLAIVLLVAAAILSLGIIPGSAEFRWYALPVWLLAGGWLALPWIWHRRQVQRWLATFLLAPWLALAGAGIVGLWGNYNPDVKAALTNSQLASVLQAHPVSVVVKDLQPEEHKTWVLLSFYSPRLGRSLASLADLPLGEYAWVSPGASADVDRRYATIATIRNWKLVTSATLPSTVHLGIDTALPSTTPTLPVAQSRV